MNEEVIYRLNPATIVHSTDIFDVDTGPYPDEVLDAYRVWNRQTGILEYGHSVLFYAKQWADMATKILQGKEPGFGGEDIPMPSIHGDA